MKKECGEGSWSRDAALSRRTLLGRGARDAAGLPGARCPCRSPSDEIPGSRSHCSTTKGAPFTNTPSRHAVPTVGLKDATGCCNKGFPRVVAARPSLSALKTAVLTRNKQGRRSSGGRGIVTTAASGVVRDAFSDRNDRSFKAMTPTQTREPEPATLRHLYLLTMVTRMCIALQQQCSGWQNTTISLYAHGERDATRGALVSYFKSSRLGAPAEPEALPSSSISSFASSARFKSSALRRRCRSYKPMPGTGRHNNKGQLHADEVVTCALPLCHALLRRGPAHGNTIRSSHHVAREIPTPHAAACRRHSPSTGEKVTLITTPMRNTRPPPPSSPLHSTLTPTPIKTCASIYYTQVATQNCTLCP